METGQKRLMLGSLKGDATANYLLDPVYRSQVGLKQYSAPTESSLFEIDNKWNKDPVAPSSAQYPAVTQVTGVFALGDVETRRKGSCTRESLLQNQFVSEVYPIPASVSMVIEPFQRQGLSSRTLAKDAYTAHCT
jgi:hypothetical protein